MTGKRRPVELKTGALHALLRQPDLPPDLAAKIQERAAAEDKRRKLDGKFRRRLPTIIVSLVAIAVAAILALIVLPETNQTKSEAAVAPVIGSSDVNPVVVVSPVPEAPSNAALPANEAVDVTQRSMPAAVISGPSQAMPGQAPSKVTPKSQPVDKAPAPPPERTPKARASAETKQSAPSAPKESAAETALPTQAPPVLDIPARSSAEPAPANPAP